MQIHDFFKWMQKQWQEFLLDDYSLIQGGCGRIFTNNNLLCFNIVMFRAVKTNI